MRKNRTNAFILFFAGVVALAFILSTSRKEPAIPGPLSNSSAEAACHSFRRFFEAGATLVRAKFGTEIVAGQDDWPDVVRLMGDLAEQRGLYFRDASDSKPGVDTLALSACAPGQPLVWVNEIEWDWSIASELPRPPEIEPYIRFGIYGDVPETIWQPVAADLVAMLEARWPNRVRFRDENSYLTDDRPDFLHPKP